MHHQDDAPRSQSGEHQELVTALRETEAGFREFIDRCPDAVFVRRGSRIIHVNDALIRLLGFERHELLGTDPATTFTHPAHRAAVLAHRANSADETDLREVRWVRKNGEILDMEVVGITAVFEGQPSRICMCRDLSERKRMQARLMVATHLASVGTLAAGIAHEISNPLASIIANLRQLTREPPGGIGPGSETGEILTDVLEAAQRVRRIVEGLRTFSSCDDGRRERLRLVQVIDTAVELAAGEIRGRARLVKEYGEVGQVEANESRLVQVLVNLLLNAAHAIPAGRPDANEIRVELAADGSGWAVIAIRDTGVGIAPEKLTRIFDPFFTTKAPRDGVGLGLSICHNIVTALGGEIAVESRAGLGSTFRITLPIAAAPPPVPGARDRNGSARER